MTQPSLFNDATGSPLFSCSPIRATETAHTAPQQTHASDNLPLFTGKPEEAAFPADFTPQVRIDMRDKQTAERLTHLLEQEKTK